MSLNDYFRSMATIYGDFEVTLDSKGRFMIPAGLKKQYSEADGNCFIANRGFEKCVTIYTEKEWEKVVSKISKLNEFNMKARKFKRMFLNGATRIEADAAGRLLVPKGLMAYADISIETKDIILVGQMDKVEIWPAANYGKKMEDDFEEYDSLGEELLGGEFTNPITES